MCPHGASSSHVRSDQECSHLVLVVANGSDFWLDGSGPSWPIATGVTFYSGET